MIVAPGIEKDEKYCGGSARLAGTRMPVWILVTLKQWGLSDRKILAEIYPHLSQSQLDSAWSYYAENQDEIAGDLPLYLDV